MAIFFLNMNLGGKFRFTPDGEDWVRLAEPLKRKTACPSCRKVLVSAVRADSISTFEVSKESIKDEASTPEYAKKVANRQIIYPPTDQRLIIAGFPGIGKTTLAKESVFNLDLDPKKFAKNGFAQSYTRNIESEKQFRSLIMTSSDQLVLNAMKGRNIDFVLVYPGSDLKDQFAPNMSQEEWDEQIQFCEKQDCKKFVLKRGQYLSDIIGELMEV